MPVIFRGRTHFGSGPRLTGRRREATEQFVASTWQPVKQALEGDFREHAGLGDSQEANKLRFKVKEGSLRGRMAVQKTQCSFEKIKDFGQGGVCFGATFDEFDGVSTECNSGVFGTNTCVGIEQESLPQAVQVARAGGLELNIAEMKEVENPGHLALWTQGSFSNGFDAAVFRGKPGNNEACLCEAGAAQKDGVGLVH